MSLVYNRLVPLVPAIDEPERTSQRSVFIRFSFKMQAFDAWVRLDGARAVRRIEATHGFGTMYGTLSMFISTDDPTAEIYANDGSDLGTTTMASVVQSLQYPSGIPAKLQWGWTYSKYGAMPEVGITLHQPVFEYKRGGVDATFQWLLGPASLGAAVPLTLMPTREWKDETIDVIITHICVQLAWHIGRIDPCPVKLTVRMENDQTPLSFIREKLIPKAVDANGGGYYCGFDLDERFYFTRTKLPTNGTGTATSVRLKKEYIIGMEFAGGSRSFAPRDAQAVTAMFGIVNNAAVLGAAGEAVSHTSMPGRGVNNAGVGAHLSGAESAVVIDNVTGLSKAGDTTVTFGSGGYAFTDVIGLFTLTQDSQKKFHVVPASTQAIASTQAKAKAADAFAQAFMGSLAADGVPYVRPTDYIQIAYFVDSPMTDMNFSATHYLTGPYQVIEIKHTVSADDWGAVMEVQRSGVNSTNLAAGAGTSNVGPTLTIATDTAVTREAWIANFVGVPKGVT